MAHSIRVLPDHVVNQIAAGEVVERPAAVVRELLDNSIDAGADDVILFIADGGQTSIRVLDNGGGISKDEALLAIERHATSKLSGLEDLQKIKTFGFRGEALSSIASVSRFRLRTRRRGVELGTEVEVNGGKLGGVSAVSCAEGTEVEVRNLFFNTPARRKFLKSTAVEERRIRDWVKHSSLSNPHVRYRLFSDDREIVNLPKVESIFDRAISLFRGNMIRFDCAYDEVIVRGMMGHPSLAQADSSVLLILVNGRLVTDRAILRAVKEGFGPTLKEREFPVGFVSLLIDPSSVDVNVNPQKSEVRFSHPQKIFVAVRDVISDAVREFRSPVPFKHEEKVEPPVFWKEEGNRQEILSIPKQSRLYEVSQSSREVVSEERFEFSSLRYIGQLLECYLLCERDGVFYIVDMHAAHERCNYNRIRNSFKSKLRAGQNLLIPLEVKLTVSGCENVIAHAEMLETFGFSIDKLDEETVVIRSVPAYLQHGNLSAMVKEIAAIPSDECSDAAVDSRINSVAARLACHGSIRSGRLLEAPEVYALFEQLDRAEFSAACPHGRPVIVSFGEKEVEQWFGRDR